MDDDYPLPIESDVQSLLGRLDEIFADLIWGQGEIVWEDPAKIENGIASARMNEALHERLLELEQELLIESAYFVP